MLIPYELINKDLARPGIYKALRITETRVYIPGLYNCVKSPIKSDGTVDTEFVNENSSYFPEILFCAPNKGATTNGIPSKCWVTFEAGDGKRPVILGYLGDSIRTATSTGSSVSSGGYIQGSIPYSKYIIIGDSRTNQLVNDLFNNGSSIPSNECYICLGCMGYKWFSTGDSSYTGEGTLWGYDKNTKKSHLESWNVIKSIEDSIVENSAIVILLGCNDAGVFNYGNILDSKVKEWKNKGATTYFFTVGPIQDSQDSNVISFNNSLKSYCDKNKDVIIYDLYSKIKDSAVYRDALHYKPETAKVIHDSITSLKSSAGGITLNDISGLDKKSYLELVMPIFQNLCRSNGIQGRSVTLKYPGVFALQPFYEVSANFPKELSTVARSDNNLGGLKYKSTIPGATQGTAVPSNETGVCYCRFKNISDYFYAQIYNAKSDAYSFSHSHQESVTSFTKAFLNTWVKGYSTLSQFDIDVAYSASLLKDYETYGLNEFEIDTNHA